VSLIVLLAVFAVFNGTCLGLPVLISCRDLSSPCATTLGIAWILASLRHLPPGRRPVISLFTTILMFCPRFYRLGRCRRNSGPYIMANPLNLSRQSRTVLIWGRLARLGAWCLSDHCFRVGWTGYAVSKERGRVCRCHLVIPRSMFFNRRAARVCVG